MSLSIYIHQLWNQINPKYGFVDKNGKSIFKPKTASELLKYVKKDETDISKINLQIGRIRFMLEELKSDYLFEQVKQQIQEKHVASKFMRDNPEIFKGKDKPK